MSLHTATSNYPAVAMSVSPRFSLLFAVLALGCAVQTADPIDEEDGAIDAEAVKAADLFYVSVARDLRKCASPMCGGYFVTALDGKDLVCRDGTHASQCYVASLEGTVVASIEVERGVILQGKVGSKYYGKTLGSFGRFTASRAWQAPAIGTPSGDYYLMSPKTSTTFFGLKLGNVRRRSIDAIDFAKTPESAAERDAALAAAHTTDGPIVVGVVDKSKTLAATQLFMPVHAKTTVCGTTLTSQIATAAKGMLWPSESDYPLDVFEKTGAAVTTPITIEQFRALVGAASTELVEEPSYTSVMDSRSTIEDWMDDGQIATAKQFQALRAVLEKNLTGLQVFRVGKISIKVYVVGKSACGDLVGVSSTVIET